MKYDAIVIGAGQAGPGVAVTIANEGKKVALVEGDKLGGTCLNYGCRPTKTLRMSARVAHMVRRAEEYGIKIDGMNVDFSAVMARKNDIIGGMQDGTKEYFTSLEGVDIYWEYGHFLESENGLHRVQVGDDILEASQVYINTGARALIPPIDGIEDVPYITNVGILDLDTLPEHLIIVGGSYIGLEFGQMFRRFGSEVTIIESASHIASHEDPDVSEAVADLLEGEGIQIYTNHRAVATATDGDQIRVTIKNKTTDEENTITGSDLLIATGRKPNSDKLNLEAVGVETDDNGYIVTTPTYETNIEGIWALGDVNGRGAFTHTSVQDYEILVATMNGKLRSADERFMTYAMFVDPPLGRVGMNETEARESGRNVLMAKYQMSDVSRAQLDSETEGLIKILVDADTEEIIGALFFGKHGDDMVQIISNFMYTGTSYKVMQNALPIHPTIAEFLPTILAELKPLEEYETADV